LNDSIWVVATDGGVFATLNRGVEWEPVGNLPTIPVYDLDADTITDRLIAGTFARSMLSFPLDSLLPTPAVVEPNDIASIEALHLKVYPNPFASAFNVELPRNAERVTVQDASGRTTWQAVHPRETLVVNASDWVPGMYFLTVTAAMGTRTVQVQKVR
jgi:hypothetical protein